jgi:hypothetical protein
MRETQHILKSRDVSMREAEAEKLKHQQKREMESRWVEKPIIAGGDIDMADALAQVRKSDVSIPVGLSRYNGTYLYTQMTTPPKGKR